MPAQYEAIRDSLPKSMGMKQRKERAAKIFISRGKGGSRSDRARELQSDRKPSR